MLDQSDTAPCPSIWDFACAFYGGEGVKDDCLTAQDAFGLPVTSLIFALYCVKYGRAVDLNAARTLGADLSAKRVVPLRTARRNLPASSEMRAASLAAELEAERAVLEALVELTLPRAETCHKGDLSSPATAGEVGAQRSEGASADRNTPSVSFADSSPVGRGSIGASTSAALTVTPTENDPTPYQSALLSIAGLEQGACPSNLGDVLKRLALAAQKM